MANGDTLINDWFDERSGKSDPSNPPFQAIELEAVEARRASVTGAEEVRRQFGGEPLVTGRLAVLACAQETQLGGWRG